MPFLALDFDDATTASIISTRTRLAEGCAAFSAGAAAPHIPLIGSLHNYAASELADHMALEQPLSGHFIRWDIDPKSKQLRVLAQVDGADILRSRLHACLPLGRPWQLPMYVTVGCAAAIEESQHAAFLVAVQDAFPIDTTATFLMKPMLSLHDTTPARRTNPTSVSVQRGKTVGEEMSVDSLIKSIATTRPQPKKGRTRKARKPSPHLKWENPAVAVPTQACRMDLTSIKKKARSMNGRRARQ